MAVRARGLQRAPGTSWLAAGGLLLLGSLALMLAVGRGAPNLTSLAVLVSLVSAGVWLGALPLLGGRVALAGLAGSLLVLNLIRLPVTSAVPYRWRQALYRTDQTIDAQVTFDQPTQTPALRVLAEPHLTSATPSFQLQTTTPFGTTTWSCPWHAGQQWLLLPLPSAASGSLPVSLTVVGQPARDRDYVIVFGENEAGGFLIEAGDAGQPAGATVCSAAA